MQRGQGSVCRFPCLLICLFFAFGVGLPPTVAAQPQTMRLDDYPIIIEYFPKDEKIAGEVGAICQDVIDDLAMELGLSRLQPVRAVLIPDITEFEKQQGIELPSWGIAFALMENQIMLVDVQRATVAWSTLRKTIPHELSHLLVAQRVEKVALPLWFLEGLAQWQAGQWSILENWRLMESVWAKRAPGLGQITQYLPREESRVRDAYRVAYLGFTARFDGHMDQLPEFLDEVVATGDFATAFESFWNESEYVYYARFDHALYRKYQTRLLLFQTGPLFSILAVLFLFVVIRIKLRNRNKLKRLEDIDRGLRLEE